MKIKNITIETFRGISNSITVDFSKNENPISTIFFGDNGTGKSSIVDAVEFNLKGKLERSDSMNNEFRPSVSNLNNDIKKGSKTTLIFEDNSINLRDISVEYDNEKNKFNYNRSNTKTYSSFSIAPIVLRRNDILSYSITPKERKQILFWSFVYKTSTSFDKIDSELDPADSNLVSEFSNERLQLKSARKKLIRQLSQTLKMIPEDIPMVRNDLDHFIKNKIRNGFSKQQFLSLKEKGYIKEINFKAIRLSDKLLAMNEEISLLNSKIGKLKKVNLNSDVRKNEIKVFLNEASQELTSSFLQISNLDFVKEIKVKIGEQTELSFEIEILPNNGIITYPNKIFSEANLDLLILLLYTSIIKEANKYGQSKLIVLDDVLQSIDATIRINFIDYLLKTFKDWQILITTHDRLWLNQLKSSFLRNNHAFKQLEIFNWDFTGGLTVYEENFQLQNKSLLKALKTNDAQIIASQTGLFLEYICNILSMNLNISVQRKKDDKYTIGDLWPGIVKYLKKTTLPESVLEIDKLIHIRNLLGAHYNEWAISLSDFEISNFAKLVNLLYENLFCSSCHSWITKENECQCKFLNLNI